MAAISRCSPVQMELRWSRVKYWTGRIVFGSNSPGSFSSISDVSRFMHPPPRDSTDVQPACHGRGPKTPGLFVPTRGPLSTTGRASIDATQGQMQEKVCAPGPRVTVGAQIGSSMPHDDAVASARMHCLARLARPTSHEVRGALSALNIHLELLADALDTDEAAVRDRRTRHLAVLRDECARLQRVIEAFIALAALPDRPGDSDFGTIVSGVLEAVRPLAVTRRVQLEATPVSPGMCPGTELEASRQRLLDALVETLGAASAGSVVRIEAAPGGRSVRVQGADGASIEVSLPASRRESDA